MIAPPPFPEKTAETGVSTYSMPNVLKSVDSTSGRDVLTIINGGNMQLPMLTEFWFSDDEVPSPKLFVIQARNQIALSGQVKGAQPIGVINDDVTYGGKTISASNPTATEYFAQVGKQVFIFFRCDLVDSRLPVYAKYRGPQFGNAGKPLYAVRQTSFILP